MLKKCHYIHNAKKAFSFIELSVVIAVLAFIAAAMLPNRNSNIQVDKVKISHDRIQAIYKAMGEYLIINRKLPCPAPINQVKATSSNYGVASVVDGDCATSVDNSTDGIYQSSTSGATDLVYGMVPVATLGLAEEFAEDGFESKFDYIVHNDFTNAATFGVANTNNTSFLTNSATTGFGIINNVDITSENAVSQKAVFAIISHGANKLGAFDANSNVISAAPTNTPEIANSASGHNDTPDTNIAVFAPDKYVASLTTTTVSGRMYYTMIDDIVFAKTRDDIVRDFNAYSLIPCQDNGKNSSLIYGATTMIWPDETLYGQDAISETLCPSSYDGWASRPTKRCGPFGIWQASVSVACTP